MKIFIGADHNGFDFKAELTKVLQQQGLEVVDEGSIGIEPEDDFPQYAAKVATALLATNDPQALGILICGSGQGVCMAANRFKGIRACLCWNENEARASRNDDDSNILCLAARYMSLDEAVSVTQTFLATPFAGAPRFTRRIQQLDQLS